MKKTLICFIAAILAAVLLLAGCGSEGEKQEATESGADAAPTEPDYGYDLTSPKSAEWFDDAVFVGDSVTLKLSYYCAAHPEALGSAEFFCAGSLGYTNALWDLDDPEAVHPYYQGDIHLAKECSKLTGKSNVFIMLGMNDIGLYGTQGALDSCKTLVADILEISPDAHIYIQSVTPMIETAQMETFNNALVKEFDDMLKAYCEENHYKYLDIYSALANENGALPDNLCSDPEAMGLHFNDVSCKMWVDYLKENA